MEVGFKPSFLRQYKKLSNDLQQEAEEKITLFINSPNHPSLKVHKLKGEFAGLLNFSVNYRYRIIFEWEKPNASAVLLEIGDHSIYG